VTATTTLSLVIHQPTFTLSSGGTIDIGQGKSGSTYIFLIPQYGFTGTVNLTVSGLPTGVTASFAPNTHRLRHQRLTLTASSSASLGVTTLTITGASGGQTATTTLALGIFVPTFTLSSGGTLNMGQGTSSDTYVYVNPEYGFNGNVTLSVSVCPPAWARSGIQTRQPDPPI